MLSRVFVLLALTCNLFALDEVAWKHFSNTFIAKDGRVIDYQNKSITHTEGIGYALFFAYAHNDSKVFAKVFDWYQNNMQKNALNLPGWKWGEGSDKTWHMLDMNSASDADLWICYALFLMGKKEGNERYIAEAKGLLDAIQKHLILKQNGRFYLLAGEKGFESEAGMRLNPSYYHFEIFEYLAQYAKVFTYLKRDGITLLEEARYSKLALNPDWLMLKEGQYQLSSAFARYSYDAIRVPLNLLRMQDAQRDRLLEPYINFVAMMQNHALGSVDLVNENISLRDYSFGHLAVYVAIAKEFGLAKDRLEQELRERIQTEHDNYYAYALYLFTRI